MTANAIPPGPPGLPILGHLLEFREPLAYMLKAHRNYGDIIRFQLLNLPMYLVCHPRLAEQVLVKETHRMEKDPYTKDLSRALGQGLVTADGEPWKRHRKLVAFAFTPRRIANYADTMVASATRSAQRYAAGTTVNLHDEMSRLTLDVVVRTLFESHLAVDAHAVGRAMEVLNEYYAGSIESILMLPDWLPLPGHLRLRRAVAEIDRVVLGLIQQQRGDLDSRASLLGALLDARDDAGRGFTDQQLRDECVTLFLAGHETTALALTHALYLLAKHPAIRQQFHAELESVLAGRAPTSEDVARLALTGRIIKESMRLFPPVWAVGRKLIQPLTLDGYTLPAGSALAVSQWVNHRDPRFFPDPEAFDPDRFLPERDRELPRFAYLPFGGGPRICVGNHFAMMEAVLLLAVLGQAHHFELLPGQTLDFRPSVTLRPRGSGLLAKVVRKDSATQRAA